MIGKITSGRSFGGCVSYDVGKEQREILDACGVRMSDKERITEDFNMQRRLKPELGLAVGHISLSWSEKDIPILTPEIMVERAKEYLDKMGIVNTQWLITQHKDRPHPHVHIIYNRVNNEGQTISDRFERRRNVKVCRELTEKYGYHLAKGKQQVNRKRLTGADKLRYELFDLIKAALGQAEDWMQLEESLKNNQITIHYKFKANTDEVQGISFEKNGISFKGSDIDRSLSYGRLKARLELNKAGKRIDQKQQSNHLEPSPNQRSSLIATLLQPEYLEDGYGPLTVEDEHNKQTKRKSKSQRINS